MTTDRRYLLTMSNQTSQSRSQQGTTKEVKGSAHQGTTVQQKSNGIALKPPSPVQRKPVVQMHKGENSYDETTDDMIIYKVILIDTDEVVYIGQTEQDVGIEARFKQHQKVHDWPSDTHKIVRLETGTWTRMETSCAEQYWIDHFRQAGQLENGRNQITKSHFNELIAWQEEKGKTIFRGTAIGFPPGWKPVN